MVRRDAGEWEAGSGKGRKGTDNAKAETYAYSPTNSSQTASFHSSPWLATVPRP